MKIGVTTENGVICGHFGHAKNFSVFTVEDGKIVSREELDTQGNHCSSMPDFVLQNKIDVIITSGMGQGAIDGLAAKGVKSFSGIIGDPQIAVENYMAGKLEDAGANCAGHGDHSSCHH